jgi:phosphoglycerol transferase MdoB-like AlkP superfamily enzyme
MTASQFSLRNFFRHRQSSMINLSPRYRLMILLLLIIASVAWTSWQAWPSFFETSKLEADSRSDYLPYRIKQGDVLNQTLIAKRDGLKEITFSFDMPGSQDVPAETQISLAVYTAGKFEPVYTTSLSGDEIMGFARTTVPVKLGRKTAGHTYYLVMTVDKMPASSRLSVHTTYSVTHPLVVNEGHTGLGLTMILTYQRFNWPVFLITIGLLIILVGLLVVPAAWIGRIYAAAPPMPLLLAPILSLTVCELLNTLNTTVWLGPALSLLSYLIILLLELILVGLLGRGRLALYLNHGLFTALAIGNHFKQFFRGDPFVAGDLASLTEATHTINKLQFIISNRFLMALLVTLIYLLLFKPVRLRLKKRIQRGVLAASSALALALLIGFVVRDTALLEQKLGIKRFPWNQMMNYRVNGLVVPWIQSTANLAVHPPAAQASIPKDLYNVPANTSTTPAAANKPNIIAIMSESFCDFNNIHTIDTSEPVMPFFDSLVASPKTLHGNLLVSIFGGGTCNTEFEFLTGSSMLFLNDGSLPYNSYFNGPTQGLPTLLKQQGYRSIAIHPYLRTFWDRQLVYPNIGFDKFISLEDFPEGGLVRDFVGDEADFAQIVRTFQEKSPEERLFIFSVTMQNHFPYYSSEEILAGLKYNIKLPGLTNVESVELYLSLLRQSDDALKQLITYFDSIDEPTIVVLFGDHLPGNNNSFNNFYEQLFKKTISELNVTETAKLYETPWLIWSNYDLPKNEIAQLDGKTAVTSPNFLASRVLQLAGAVKSPYFDYLDTLNKKILALNNKMVMMQNGLVYDREHIPASVIRLLDRYWGYEYDNIVRDKAQ